MVRKGLVHFCFITARVYMKDLRWHWLSSSVSPHLYFGVVRHRTSATCRFDCGFVETPPTGRQSGVRRPALHHLDKLTISHVTGPCRLQVARRRAALRRRAHLIRLATHGQGRPPVN